MKEQKGTIGIVAMMMIAIIITVWLLVIAIFMGNVNGILYGVKTDMYLINKSAIVSVNKNRASIDDFSYDEKDYETYFKKALMKNYHLNENLENREGLIQKVDINEYTIYQKRKKDTCTGKKVDGTVIHTVITVKMKPIILKKQLEKLFTFQMHEDVSLELAKN